MIIKVYPLTKYEVTMVTITAGVTLVLPYMVIVMLCAFTDISIYVQNTAHALYKKISCTVV